MYLLFLFLFIQWHMHLVVVPISCVLTNFMGNYCIIPLLQYAHQGVSMEIVIQ